MAEIVKTYMQHMPASRFIGKRYGDEDRVDGYFMAQWEKWFENGWFEIIEKAAMISPEAFFEDGGAYIGLMHAEEGKPFQSWIGMFVSEDTKVPEGFESISFPAMELGVCWVYGREATGEIYGHEQGCLRKLEEAGISCKAATDGIWTCFERYACPRFTKPDEKGNCILDICFVRDTLEIKEL